MLIFSCLDHQRDPDFCIVARVEAFIAGWGLDEVLKRAHAYRDAGADAILMHSKRSDANEIEAFVKAWDNKVNNGNRSSLCSEFTFYYEGELMRISKFVDFYCAQKEM